MVSDQQIALVRGYATYEKRDALHLALLAVCDAAQRTAEVERERDAYKRAKAENDERFMLERDALRTTLDGIERLLRAGWMLEPAAHIKGFRAVCYRPLHYAASECESLPAAVQAALEELDRAE